MNEKDFFQDVYDVLCGNTNIITQQQFIEKYVNDADTEIDCNNLIIKIGNLAIGLL